MAGALSVETGVKGIGGLGSIVEDEGLVKVALLAWRPNVDDVRAGEVPSGERLDEAGVLVGASRQEPLPLNP